MFEKLKVSCSCFGTPKPKKQQIFYTRKRQFQEPQSPQSVIRFTNATQVINEIEGNGMKKSLKKRQGTYVHHDYNYFMIDEANKAEAEIQSSQHRLSMKNKNFLKKEVQNPIQCYTNTTPFKYPGTSNMTRQTTLANNRNQFVSGTSEDYHYVIHEPHYLNYTQNQRSITQLRPHVPDLQNQNASLNYTSPVVINQKRNNRVYQKESQPSVVLQKNSNKQVLSNRSSFIRSKSMTLQSEPWSQPRQDHSLIEDFQKLFKNAEDTSFSKISIREKNASFSREAQKYQAEKQKAYQERQQLMGRLAESEDEVLSEAPRSQIIGKGFDIIYQDLLDPNELFTVEEMKASRSTNTKLSDLRGQKHTFDEHQRMRFGKSANLTRYGHL